MQTTWNIHPGHRTEFCEKPDGRVTSCHEFKVDETTAVQDHDFQYATARCVCGQTLRASRLNKVETSQLLPDDVGRLNCSTCGMVANVDPDFHADRYAHIPVIKRDGVEWRWSTSRQMFETAQVAEVEMSEFTGGRVSNSVEHL